MCIFTNFMFPIGFIYPSGHNVPVAQTILCRGISIIITHITIFRIFNISADFPSPHNQKYLLIRNITMALHQILYTLMHFVISFPLVNTITSTGPIFVFLIDYYLNGVKINKAQMIGVIVGLLGVILVINGDYIMSLINDDYHTKTVF
jgi:drug/metabolite transporter (DMT)-like permease